MDLKIPNSLYYLILFALCLTFMIPRFIHGYWAFVDDGAFFLMFSKFQEQVEQFEYGIIFTEFKSAGRFTPLGLIIYFLRFLLIGSNYDLYIIWNIFLLFSSSVLIFKLIKKVIRESEIAFLFSVFFVFSSINIENYYRFYPYEPVLTLILIIGLNLLVEENGSITKKSMNIFLSSIIITATLFIKETSVYLPLLFLFMLLLNKYFIKDENWKKVWFYMSIISSIGFTLFYILKIIFADSIDAGHYSSLYSFNYSKMILTFGKYMTVYLSAGGLLFIFIFLIILFGDKNKFRDNINLKLFILLGFLLNIAILLPWQFAISRYLLLANFYMLILFAILFPYKEICKKKHIKILSYFVILIILTVNAIRIYHISSWLSVRDKSNRQLIKYLTTVKDPLSKNIYFVYEEKQETISQVRDLLDYLHDIKFKSIDNYKDSIELNSNDLLIFPYQTGDGHISSDKFFNNSFSDSVYYEKTKKLRTLKKINNYSSSVTIYPDFFIFKMIRQFNISIPQSVIGSYSDRDFIEKQILSKRWDIYSVI